MCLGAKELTEAQIQRELKRRLDEIDNKIPGCVVVVDDSALMEAIALVTRSNVQRWEMNFTMRSSGPLTPHWTNLTSWLQSRYHRENGC